MLQVVELEEKCRHELIVEHCKDIKWHFIGHLQRNKANKVASKYIGGKSVYQSGQ